MFIDGQWYETKLRISRLRIYEIFRIQYNANDWVVLLY